jgi:hypothetical protein
MSELEIEQDKQYEHPKVLRKLPQGAEYHFAARDHAFRVSDSIQAFMLSGRRSFTVLRQSLQKRSCNRATLSLYLQPQWQHLAFT